MTRGDMPADHQACNTCGRPVRIKRGRVMAEGEPRCRVCRREERDPEKYLGRFTHGQSAYQKGCRCDVCREIKSARLKRTRAEVKSRRLKSPG